MQISERRLKYDASYEEVPLYSSQTSGGIWRVMAVNANTIISASYDRFAKMWSLENDSGCLKFASVQVMEGHRKEVLSIARIHDDLFATGSSDGKMCFWNRDGSYLYSIEENRKSARGFYSLLALDNNRIATGACQRPKRYHQNNWEHVIKIWDLTSGRCVNKLSGHTGGISALVDLVSGQIFASSSGDSTVKVWNIADQQISCTFKGHEDYVYGLAKIHESQIVSGSRDRTIRLWDVSSEKEIGQFVQKEGIAHTSTIYDVKVFDSNLMISGSRDGYVKVWDCRNLECLRTLSADDGFVYTVDFLADGRIVAGTSGKKGVVEKEKRNSLKNNAHIVIWDLRSTI